MVFEKIRSIIADQFELDEDTITPDSTMDDLGIDSIDAVELVMSIEDEFDLEIPDEEMDNFKTVGDVVHYIEKC